MKLRTVQLLIALVPFFHGTAALAQFRYEFVNIVDSTGEFASTLQEKGPAINDRGEVAFFATKDDGDRGVFKGSGGPITKIAGRSDVWPSPPHLSINDAGDVAFQGGFYPGLVTPHPSINEIKVGNGQRLTTIFDKRRTHWLELGDPAISDNGSVVFAVASKGHPSDLLVAKDGVIAPAFANTSGFGFSFLTHVGPPSINSTGDVAFLARFPGGHLYVFAIRENRVDPIVGPLHDAPLGLTITDAGMVTTQASNSRGASVQFSETRISVVNPRGTHTLVRHGDPLFGSTVTGLQFYRGFNNRGDVAFGYGLADGRAGIAVARVIPEPASLAVAALTLAAFTVFRRLR